MSKFRCKECDHVCTGLAVLTVPNPFYPADVLIGCPQCFAVGQLLGACDEPGCNAFSSCGGPTPDGYRTTCGKHAPWGKP